LKKQIKDYNLPIYRKKNHY